MEDHYLWAGLFLGCSLLLVVSQMIYLTEGLRGPITDLKVQSRDQCLGGISILDQLAGGTKFPLNELQVDNLSFSECRAFRHSWHFCLSLRVISFRLVQFRPHEFVVILLGRSFFT